MPRLYRYLGDRLTAPELKGAECAAILNERGKCISGRGAMLVLFAGELAPRVVIRRLLRKLDAPETLREPATMARKRDQKGAESVARARAREHLATQECEPAPRRLARQRGRSRNATPTKPII